MKVITRHFSRCFVAGVVAILPVAGAILTLVYLESTIAGSWLAEQVFYFPGAGILAALVIIYVIGLVVSTFIGRWAWRMVDHVLENLPALGALYQTLKQILGYGEGKDAMFQSVVLVPGRSPQGMELGLVTNEVDDEQGARKLVVFVPGAPTPTAGRLELMRPEDVRHIDLSVSDALKALVSVGKSSLEPEEEAAA